MIVQESKLWNRNIQRLHIWLQGQKSYEALARLGDYTSISHIYGKRDENINGTPVAKPQLLIGYTIGGDSDMVWMVLARCHQATHVTVVMACPLARQHVLRPLQVARPRGTTHVSSHQVTVRKPQIQVKAPVVKSMLSIVHY